MVFRNHSRLSVAFLLTAILVSGCTESATEVNPEASLLGLFGSSDPIKCSTEETVSATATITPLGGLLSAGGTTISLPAGAVLAPTTFTVTVPASRYMEVDISAAGVEHFIFELPTLVTIDYSRCTHPKFDGPLTVWYWDSATGELLENMLAIDNKILRRVTFTTPHLSGFVIAD